MHVRLLATLAVIVACFSTLPSAPRGTRHEIADSNSQAAYPLSNSDFTILARTDPVGMFEAAVRRYRQEVRGFRATLHKQERLADILHPPEVVDVVVRESPYAVRMIWKSGARSVRVGGFSLGTVEGVLYAAGENQGNMLVWRPGALIAPVAGVAPVGDQAKAASRYALTEAGLGAAAERTRRAWEVARNRGQLQVEFLGTKSVPEVGGRLCHVWRRTCLEPEVDAFVMAGPKSDPAQSPADAFTTVTVMIDADTWLQAGSELRRDDGELVGAYYFRDVQLNPQFGPEEFQPVFKR